MSDSRPVSPTEVDFSVIRTSIDMGHSMIDQILHGIHYGSREVQTLLREECDFILECKVCRNLFRSFPNLVAHKRVYCMETSVEKSPEQKNILMNESETIIVQPESPSGSEKSDSVNKMGKGKANQKSKDVESVVNKVVENTYKGNSKEYQLYTKVAEKVEKVKAGRVTNTVNLTPIPTTSKAVIVNYNKEVDVDNVLPFLGAITKKDQNLATTPNNTDNVQKKKGTLTDVLAGLMQQKQSRNNKDNRSISQAVLSSQSERLRKSVPKKLTSNTIDTDVTKSGSGSKTSPMEVDDDIKEWASNSKESNSSKQGNNSSKQGSNSSKQSSPKKTGSPEKMETSPVANQSADKPWLKMCDFDKLMCLTCEKVFSYADTLKVHAKSIHWKETVLSKCPLCQKEFMYFSSVERHLRNFHQKTDKQIEEYRKKVNARSKFVERITPESNAKLKSLSSEKSGYNLSSMSGWKKCDKCQKFFSKVKTYKRHLKRCAAKGTTNTTAKGKTTDNVSEGKPKVKTTDNATVVDTAGKSREGSRVVYEEKELDKSSMLYKALTCQSSAKPPTVVYVYPKSPVHDNDTGKPIKNNDKNSNSSKDSSKEKEKVIGNETAKTKHAPDVQDKRESKSSSSDPVVDKRKERRDLRESRSNVSDPTNDQDRRESKTAASGADKRDSISEEIKDRKDLRESRTNVNDQIIKRESRSASNEHGRSSRREVRSASNEHVSDQRELRGSSNEHVRNSRERVRTHEQACDPREARGSSVELDIEKRESRSNVNDPVNKREWRSSSNEHGRNSREKVRSASNDHVGGQKESRGSSNELDKEKRESQHASVEHNASRESPANTRSSHSKQDDPKTQEELKKLKDRLMIEATGKSPYKTEAGDDVGTKHNEEDINARSGVGNKKPLRLSIGRESEKTPEKVQDKLSRSMSRSTNSSPVLSSPSPMSYPNSPSSADGYSHKFKMTAKEMAELVVTASLTKFAKERKKRAHTILNKKSSKEGLAGNLTQPMKKSIRGKQIFPKKMYSTRLASDQSTGGTSQNQEGKSRRNQSAASVEGNKDKRFDYRRPGICGKIIDDKNTAGLHGEVNDDLSEEVKHLEAKKKKLSRELRLLENTAGFNEKAYYVTHTGTDPGKDVVSLVANPSEEKQDKDLCQVTAANVSRQKLLAAQKSVNLSKSIMNKKSPGKETSKETSSKSKNVSVDNKTSSRVSRMCAHEEAKRTVNVIPAVQTTKDVKKVANSRLSSSAGSEAIINDKDSVLKALSSRKNLDTDSVSTSSRDSSGERMGTSQSKRLFRQLKLLENSVGFNEKAYYETHSDLAASSSESKNKDSPTVLRLTRTKDPSISKGDVQHQAGSEGQARNIVSKNSTTLTEGSKPASDSEKMDETTVDAENSADVKPYKTRLATGSIVYDSDALIGMELRGEREGEEKRIVVSKGTDKSKVVKDVGDRSKKDSDLVSEGGKSQEKVDRTVNVKAAEEGGDPEKDSTKDLKVTDKRDKMETSTDEVNDRKNNGAKGKNNNSDENSEVRLASGAAVHRTRLSTGSLVFDSELLKTSPSKPDVPERRLSETGENFKRKLLKENIGQKKLVKKPEFFSLATGVKQCEYCKKTFWKLRTYSMHVKKCQKRKHNNENDSTKLLEIRKKRALSLSPRFGGETGSGDTGNTDGNVSKKQRLNEDGTQTPTKVSVDTNQDVSKKSGLNEDNIKTPTKVNKNNTGDCQMPDQSPVEKMTISPKKKTLKARDEQDKEENLSNKHLTSERVASPDNKSKVKSNEDTVGLAKASFIKAGSVVTMETNVNKGSKSDGELEQNTSSAKKKSLAKLTKSPGKCVRVPEVNQDRKTNSDASDVAGTSTSFIDDDSDGDTDFSGFSEAELQDREQDMDECLDVSGDKLGDLNTPGDSSLVDNDRVSKKRDAEDKDDLGNEEDIDQDMEEVDDEVDEIVSDKSLVQKKKLRKKQNVNPWAKKRSYSTSYRAYVCDGNKPRKMVCQLTKNVDKIIDTESLVCKYCDSKHSSVSNLRQHAIRHLGWKRYKCNLCPYTGYNLSEVKLHLSRTHSIKSSNLEITSFVTDLKTEARNLRVSKRSNTLREQRAKRISSQSSSDIYARPRPAIAVTTTKAGRNIKRDTAGDASPGKSRAESNNQSTTGDKDNNTLSKARERLSTVLNP